MNFHIYPSLNEFNFGIADWMVAYIKKTLATKDTFTLALSGGNTPKMLYELLSQEPYKHLIDWQKIHIFWGDERFVAASSDQNNAHVAYETLLNKVDVNPQNIHPFNTSVLPEDAAIAYEQLLHRYFDNGTHTFDLTLLGLGDNGHTLSLFPHTKILHEQQHWVQSFWLEEQQMFRISLTAPVVNQSAAIAFLVSGNNKASVVKEVVKGKKDVENYPAQLINPINKDILHWFLDDNAAKLLNNNEK